MTLEQLSNVNRAIGVAGGARKFDAILGALHGKWINILVTDHFTARRLAKA
jgi:DNA-binding transcriptional regulator LsrR (DeoR family)